MFFQLTDDGLQVFPYPMEKSTLDDKEELTSPPLGVSVTLPDTVVFLETPQVARWDDAGRAVSHRLCNTFSGMERPQKVTMRDINMIISLLLQVFLEISLT